MPYNGVEDVINERRYNQGYLVTYDKIRVASNRVKINKKNEYCMYMKQVKRRNKKVRLKLGLYNTTIKHG